MKKAYSIILILVSLFAIGCSHFPISIQVVHDEQLLSIAKPVVEELAIHVKQDHPEDVKSYIRYCDVILLTEDPELIEAYINNGIDILLERLIDNAYYRIALKSLKGMFEIDVDTGQIIFDTGSLRTALDLVKVFRDKLDDRTISMYGKYGPQDFAYMSSWETYTFKPDDCNACTCSGGMCTCTTMFCGDTKNITLN